MALHVLYIDLPLFFGHMYYGKLGNTVALLKIQHLCQGNICQWLMEQQTKRKSRNFSWMDD